MSLRDQIEVVLRKNSKCCDPAYPEHPTPYVVQVTEKLVDDLLACVHQPSRGTLAIMLQEGFTHKVLAILTEPIPGRTQTWFDKLLDDLMAWATSQWERVWCEHCIWDTEGDFKTTSDPRYHVPHWCFKEPGMKPTPIRNEWVACPLCAAPRPEDA